MTQEQVVWITGASSGLGKATARALVKAGFRVVSGARSFREQEGESDLGNQMYLDVCSDTAVQVFVSRAIRHYGLPDVLINCAGILCLGACESYTQEEIRQVMDTDFAGMTRMISAVLPLMREKGKGRIVNFSSINGLLAVPYQGIYTAAKHAVEGYSESLQLETAPFGIEVMVVEPGDHQSGSDAYRHRSAGMNIQSPYSSFFAKTTAAIAHDEKNGCDPEKLGRKIARVLKRKHLPFRLCIAKADQHLAVILHKLLPYRLFSRILSAYYGSGQKKGNCPCG